MTAFFNRFRQRPRPAASVDQERLSDRLASLSAEAQRARQTVLELQDQLRAEQQRADQLSALARQAGERARLAGMPFARLGSDSLILEGPSVRRLSVNRLSVGEAVEHAVASRLGVVVSATADPRIQALWDGLHGEEGPSPDDRLRGASSTVLDIPGAVLRLEDGGRTLRVSMRPSLEGGADSAGGPGILAVPKFTFDFAQRKLRNFGHWLLDCVPQVVTLSALAPSATFLLAAPLRGFQRRTLELVGLPPSRAVGWDGAPMAGDRVLVFESDGRAGGRPLSALLETRRLLASRGITARTRGTRRIYVSRRDADPKRRWVSNEPMVEASFKRLGFDVLVMEECPLEQQIEVFRDAAVVAGVSGAGLSDIMFTAPDAHVVVLLSDSLMSWYADQRGSRSGWVRTGSTRPLSTLGDSPLFYVHLAAAFEQYCHCFLTSDEVPIPQLSAFLERVLARVDA